MSRFLPTLLLCATACAGSCAAPEPTPGLQGVVEIDEIAVSFEASGPIVSLEVARGDEVELGAVLGRLDDALVKRTRVVRAAEVDALAAELALLQAGTRGEEVRATAARLAAAREIEHLVRAQLERQQKLVDQGAAPRVSLDPYQQQLSQSQGERRALSEGLLAQRRGARPQQIEALQARLAAAQAALAAEDERLRRYTLHAPRAGTVIDLHFEAGEMAPLGAAVVTLGDRAHPYVDMFVPQAQLASVTLRRPAKVQVDAFDEPFDAEVEHVAARTEFTPRYLFSDAERQSLVVRVRMRVQDPERKLPSGVPAFVRWADE